jgi:dihydroorotate dehydrogenase
MGACHKTPKPGSGSTTSSNPGYFYYAPRGSHVEGNGGPILQEVSGWVNKKATIPVWSKMTPNITDITLPARTALLAGSEGIAAINTIQSVMGINLDTLRPEPSVEGYSTPGGYSCKAVKPIALAKVHIWAGKDNLLWTVLFSGVINALSK